MAESLHAASDKVSTDSLFVQAAQEYRTSLADGKNPSIEQFAERFPEIGDVIRQVFPVFAKFPVFELVSVPSDDIDGSDEQKRQVPKLPQTLGDYRLVREIGRGGMGIVYEAYQISLDKRVALKILPFAGVLDPRSLQRFQNEAKAAAQLQHPNIVPVHAVGCDRGTHFYAMRFIEGHNLAQIVRQLQQVSANQEAVLNLSPTASIDHVGDDVDVTTPLPELFIHPSAETSRSSGLMRFKSTKASVSNVEYLRSFVEAGIQVAEALQHAHDTGIVHRDIKPSNLMLDTAGNIWVTDFGLAQIRGNTTITVTGDVIGTLRYMSPEQALAKRVIVDHRTDIYSLGATLYELLTLRPAFDGGTREEVMRQIAFEEPIEPRKLDRRIPAELEVIVLKAITKNPDERYQTARELAEDLRRYQSDEPIRARRPSIPQRVGKWTKRHRNLVLSGVALSIVVFIATLISSWQIYLALGAEKEARHTAESLLAQSEGSRLAILSLFEKARGPGRALSLAIEGRRRYASAETNNAVLQSLSENHELKTLREHRRSVGHVAFSADGKFLLTTGLRSIAPADAEPAIIWEAQSGKLLRRLQGNEPITSATFSPSGGRILVSYAPQITPREEGDARTTVGAQPAIYDATTGSKLVELPDAFLPQALAASFSPNGQRVVTPALGNRATVYDVVEGFRQMDLLGHTGRVHFAAFSPTGKYLVTISQDRSVRVWLAATGEEVYRLATWKEVTPEVAIFSPDERVLATGSYEGAHLWDVASGRMLNELQLVGDLVAFSADGRRLVTAQKNSPDAYVYGTSSGEKLLDIKTGVAVRALDVSSTGRHFALACANVIDVRSLETGDSIAQLRGHDQNVLALRFASSGLQLASGASDRTARLWSIRSGSEELTIHKDSEIHRENFIAFSPRGAFAPQADRMVATRIKTQHAYAFDLQRNKRVAEFQGQVGEDSYGGNRVITINSNSATIVDFPTRKELFSYHSPLGNLKRAMLSRNGKLALLTTVGGSAILWDLEKDRAQVLPLHSDRIADATLDGTGEHLATACRDGTVRLWKTTLELVHTWKMPGPAEWVRFNAANDRLIAVSDPNVGRVWSVPNGQHLFDLASPTVKFNRAYFSASGEQIITFDWFDNVALASWQTSDGKLLHTLPEAQGTINVSLAHNSPLVAIASRQTGLYRWNLESGEWKRLEQAGMKYAAFEPNDQRLVAATFSPPSEPEFTPKDSPSVSLSPRLQIWDLTNDELKHILPTQLGSVTYMTTTATGELLVSARFFAGAIYEVPGRTKIADLLGHSAPLSGLLFGDQGKSIVTASSDQTLGIWDSSTGNLIRWLDGHKSGVTSLAISPNFSKIASGAADGEVIVWDSASGNVLRRLLGHKDMIYHLLYSPSGDQLLSNSRDGTIRIWNEQGETVHSLTSTYGVYLSVDWSKKGDLLVVPGGERIATQQRISTQFPDAASLKEKIKEGAPAKIAVQLYRTFGAAPVQLDHDSPPRTGSFNSDGTRAITVDQAGVAQIWSVAETPQKMQTIRKHHSPIVDASFSPNGKYVLTRHFRDYLSSTGDRSGFGNNAYLWDAETGEELVGYPGENLFFGAAGFVNPRVNPFTPDDAWIISVESAVTLKRWPTDVLRYAEPLMPAELTAEEKAAYRVSP